ncbi:hypothetical protein GCM10009007_13080 [Formosimonas limnophila]|uniref:Transposase InsH N-terminal domain-containing protein n=1 Tax=Formosimonas limnophila TaxID=1384487 RepID=A0A8J3G0P1_9BURK|nr:hypothetical protein GCM10009007_13080 [Formosimonas limnophila]
MARDLVFRRFAGMGISDAVPHHTIFVRFRATLRQHGLFEVLFNEINQQLTAQSIILKLGQISIIDATVTQAHCARPRKGSDGNNTQAQKQGITSRPSPMANKPTPMGLRTTLMLKETASSPTLP